MKLKQLLLICIGLFLITDVTAGTAAALEDTKSGLSGYILLGAAYSSSDLSLADAQEDSNKTIQSLNQSGRSESELIPVITGAVNYTFASTGTTIGAGEMGDALGIFASQDLGSAGVLTLGYGYEEEDVFSDPFVTGAARSVTDREIHVLSISLDDIMDSGITFAYDLESVELDNDAAGRRDHRLKRDGEIHSIGAEAELFENDLHQFGIGAAWIIGDLSGVSCSYDGYEVGLFHVLKGGQWELETALAVGIRDYDGVHPEFNKTRDDREWEVSAAYTFFQPFGFKNYFVTVFASYTDIDANIDFYDASSITTGMGIGYTF